jgi:hypothetical protein
MKTQIKTIVARDQMLFLWWPLYRPWTTPLRSLHGHVNLKPVRIFEQGGVISFGRN